MDTEEEKSKWFKLPAELRSIIVTQLDNKSKRALRATCLKNFALVNEFQCMNYEGDYNCILYEAVAPSGQRGFALRRWMGTPNGPDYHESHQLFRSFEAFIDGLQSSLKNIDTVEKFCLNVVGFTEPIQLLKNQKKLKANTLSLSLQSNPAVADGFPNQFDTDFLEFAVLSGENLGDDIFEAFEGKNFCIHHVDAFNDAQLLSISAQIFVIEGSNQLTVSGVKDFLKKMLKKNETKSAFEWHKPNEELLNVFDYGRRTREARIFISPDYCDYTLMIEVILQPRDRSRFRGVIISRDRDFRNRPIRLGPALQSFVESIMLDQ